MYDFPILAILDRDSAIPGAARAILPVEIAGRRLDNARIQYARTIDRLRTGEGALSSAVAKRRKTRREACPVSASAILAS